MKPAHERQIKNSPRTTGYRVGCVSFLNSKPLIEGVDDQPDTAVRFDVPARLLDDLLDGQVDIALCPVIDYFRAPKPLQIVPVGGICCEGPTFTVRLYSRVPIERINTIHADTDSHTSVALSQVLLDKLHQRRPRMIDYHAREHVAEGKLHEKPETMLLIGDKVVTDSPLAVEYPYQMDLGEAWHEMTGLPFMFAVWLARADAELGDLPKRLAEQRAANARKTDDIVARYAAGHGWPRELARRYLGEILKYEVTSRELEAMERFGRLAEERGLIEAFRPLDVRDST